MRPAARTLGKGSDSCGVARMSAMALCPSKRPPHGSTPSSSMRRSFAADDDLTRVLDAGKKPEDARLGKAKTLNDYFPFAPPATKEAWEARKKELREQLLVALGLWPMPEKTPLSPVIHGKIDRDDYT